MTSTTARDRESKELEDIHLSFGGHLYLNWSDAHVRNEMTDVFRFWINRGVDGFFLKDVHFLQVAHLDDIYSSLFEILRVVDPSTSPLLSPLSKPSVHSDIKSSFFLSSQENQTRILITSRSSLEAIVDRHALESAIERRQEADPSSLSRIFLDSDKINTSARTSATSSRLVLLPRDPFSYFHMIDTFLDLRMNESESIRDQLNEVFIKDATFRPWILWNVGSSTSSRLSTRIGSDFVVTAAFLLFMMPGSISIFYGDEVGLRDSFDIASKRVRILISFLSLDKKDFVLLQLMVAFWKKRVLLFSFKRGRQQTLSQAISCLLETNRLVMMLLFFMSKGLSRRSIDAYGMDIRHEWRIQ